MARHPLDGAVEDEIFEAEQAREPALVAPEGCRERAKVGVLGVFARAYRPLIICEAQRVVADDVLDLEHHRGVLPRPAKTEDLDAGMVAGGVALGELALQDLQPLQLLGRQLAEHRVALRRLRVQGRGRVSGDQFAAGQRNRPRWRPHGAGARCRPPGSTAA